MTDFGTIVLDEGKGAEPWLVLVHGISQDHRVFDKQVEAFRDTHRLLLIDLPGHGRSATIGGPYGLAEFAAHIAGALTAHGIARSIFWGTHLGATAGLVLAGQRPDLFRLLLLESPVMPGRPLPSVSDLLPRLSTAVRSEGLGKARDLWWSRGPWFDRMRAQPERRRAAQHRRIIDDFEGGPWLEAGLISKPLGDVEGTLKDLPVPVTVMNGEFDVPDFVEASEVLSALLPRCRRIVVPDAGGFPLWEDPDAVNQLVSEVISRHSDRQ